MIRVALTQRTVVAATGEVRDCLDQGWAPFLARRGALTLPLPTRIDVDRHLGELEPDAVVLTGGNDLAFLAGAEHASVARDDLERQVIAWCSARQVPVLGVCRGMQMLAHLAGGEVRPVEGHVARAHPVITADGLDRPLVNSFHAYGVPADSLPDSLEPFAWDEAGNVEAFAGRSAPQLAVMWHPEREPEPGGWSVRVVSDFLAQAVRA